MDPKLQAAADKILDILHKDMQEEGLSPREQQVRWARMELIIKDALAEQGIEDI